MFRIVKNLFHPFQRGVGELGCFVVESVDDVGVDEGVEAVVDCPSSGRLFGWHWWWVEVGQGCEGEAEFFFEYVEDSGDSVALVDGDGITRLQGWMVVGPGVGECLGVAVDDYGGDPVACGFAPWFVHIGHLSRPLAAVESRCGLLRGEWVDGCEFAEAANLEGCV